MKKIVLLLCLIISLSCQAQERAPRELKFNGFLGVDWGTPTNEIYKSSIPDQKLKKWLDQNRLYTQVELGSAGTLHSIFFFNNGRLLAVTQILRGEPQRAVTNCNSLLFMLMEQGGQPSRQVFTSVTSTPRVEWSNEDTEVHLYCTDQGPIINFMQRIWLADQPHDMIHYALPNELLHNLNQSNCQQGVDKKGKEND